MSLVDVDNESSSLGLVEKGEGGEELVLHLQLTSKLSDQNTVPWASANPFTGELPPVLISVSPADVLATFTFSKPVLGSKHLLHALCQDSGRHARVIATPLRPSHATYLLHLA